MFGFVLYPPSPPSLLSASFFSSGVEGSPLFSASMTELTKARPSAAAADALAGDPLSRGGGTDDEAVGGIANVRVINASKVIG